MVLESQFTLSTSFLQLDFQDAEIEANIKCLLDSVAEHRGALMKSKLNCNNKQILDTVGTLIECPDYNRLSIIRTSLIRTLDIQPCAMTSLMRFANSRLLTRLSTLTSGQCYLSALFCV